MRVARFAANPIIRPNMDGRMGSNINGPSLIRVPEWITEPLGRYYLYFAHHDGHYIRLAYADGLEGPWTMHESGALPLSESRFTGHIASPDVHVDNTERRIRMYFHGSDQPSGVPGSPQRTRVAISNDGLSFSASAELLGRSYFRAFAWEGWVYALAMPGVVYRSQDGFTDFVQGPTLFSANMRHSALKLEGATLSVFYSNIGDAPESILVAQIELESNWLDWQTSEPLTVLKPEMPFEGADLQPAPSKRGMAHDRVCQLRDPAIFCEEGRSYLLYSVAGEHGIAIAEIMPDA
tara:strand:- start:6533 stop:7411 length:879 start_codon:yes stop_codon:yes gene_type:complete